MSRRRVKKAIRKVLIWNRGGWAGQATWREYEVFQRLMARDPLGWEARVEAERRRLDERKRRRRAA